MKVLGDCACGRLGHGGEVVKDVDVLLELLVVIEMAKVEFGEDVLHGDESVGFLFDDIGLRLLDIVSDVPAMERIGVPGYQPHLKDNKSIYHIHNQPTSSIPLSSIFIIIGSSFAAYKALIRIRQQLQIISESFSMNQLAELFNKTAHKHWEVKKETKEQFFMTKKSQKRMKTSLCLSDGIEPYEQEHHSAPINLSIPANLDFFKLDKKQLDSTFSEQPHFSFKTNPPKRKMNVRNAAKENQSLPLQKQQHLIESVFQKKICRDQCLLEGNLNSQSLFSVKKTKISDFCLMNKIGEGSYSQVFKAVHKATGFLCAIKVLQKQRMKEEGVVENVVRELKINMFADHPNIAKLYSYFYDDHYIYLICEYATDKNLYEVLYQPKLKLKKGFNNQEAAMFTKQICSAVEYLHFNYIMHRDIKPQNILLTMSNTVKICDFGWSIYNPDCQLRNTLCGTPLYLAPELIAQNEYDQSIDIWAVGIITYEMLTEQIPFDIASPKDLYRIVSDEVKIARIRNKVAADFIEKALQKDASKRIEISDLVHHPFVK